jgi:DNA polymerase-3 subunit epsilon
LGAVALTLITYDNALSTGGDRGGRMNFLAVDVETANADLASICAVGLVYFKDGQVANSLGFLINPEDNFDPVNIGVHGIRPQDVAHSPTMREIFPAIDKALSTTIVVHHTHFDKVALCRAAEKYGYASPACEWLDTARVARMAWTKFSKRGYGLRNLASEFEIKFEHHDATEDAYAAGQILLRALRETDSTLDEWMARLARSLSRSSGSRVARQGDPSGPLAGEVLVFTGELSISRAEAADLAAQVGCDVASSVTKATTILVIGDAEIRTSGARTTKHKKAEKLIACGQYIKIIGEDDFKRLVNY